MFITRKTSPSGQTLQLLESYRDADGKPRHRVVVSLGDAGIPREHWRAIGDAVELRLSGQGVLFGLDADVASWVDWVMQKVESRDQHRRRCPSGPATVDGVILGAVKHTRHTSLGPELLGLHAWDQLGLPDLLDRLGFNRTQRDTAAVSVINRLCSPLSENALATWIGTSSLVDLLGEHVAHSRKDRFYRVSDHLLDHQQKIETHLRNAQAKHFSLERTLVLYDLTNSHFEGTCRGNPKAKHGANKQKRFDCVQIAVGMVFDEHGFSLAHKTFAGNRSDSTPLIDMVAELDKMAGQDNTFSSLHRPMVIVDAGIATQANLSELRERGYGYLVNETRKNRGQYAERFAEDALFESVPDRDGKTSVRVRSMDVPPPAAGSSDLPDQDRIVLCKSAERRQKELAIRSRAEVRFLAEVEKLAGRLRKGKLKDPGKIDQAIGRMRQRGSRVSAYYDIWTEPDPGGEGAGTKLPKSILKWSRHDEAYDAGDDLMGCYVLRTTRDDLEPDTIWQVYTTLSKAEDGFRALKSNLGLRPNRHQTEDRADAHVLITVLAYHLLCFILETLSRAGDRRSWPTLRQILQTHQYATVVLPTSEGTTYLMRKPGEPEECHRQIYRHFDLSVHALPQRIVETARPKTETSVVT